MNNNKFLLVVLFYFFSIFLFAEEDQSSDTVVVNNSTTDKFRIIKIKYLSSDVLDEKVMRTFLGFKEQDVLTAKELNLFIELAKLRLRFYGVFFDISVFAMDSNENPSDKIIFIKLSDGLRDIYGGASWYFMWGRRNFLYRGDYIGFNAGINSNIFTSKHHFPVGWLYFSQETGWKWKMDVAYFPFFPLYGGTNQRYIHNLFYNGKLGFRLHPDIEFGITAGVLVNFTNRLSTINYYVSPNFQYRRTGFPIEGFFCVDQRYLRLKYLFGYKFNVSGGINLDVLNNTTFFPVKTELNLYLYPNEYVRFIHKIRLYNQFLNVPEFLQLNINNSDYQRGKILDNYTGDFLFLTNVDCMVKIFKIKSKMIDMSFGGSFFYDGSLITRNEYLATGRYDQLYYYNTIGTGFWVELKSPIDLTFFVNGGYSVFNGWAITTSIILGEL